MSLEQRTSDVLRKCFLASEADEVLQFLEKGFSTPGQIVITSVFIYAQGKGKSVAEVLGALNSEWERN